MLLKEAHKKGVELGFNLEKGYIADTAWMLKALATLNPKHKIFAKDFVPRVDKARPAAVVMIDNSDDFYSNLPDLYLKKDMRGRATACISKSEKLAQQLAREQDLLEKKQARVMQIQQDIDSHSRSKVKAGAEEESKDVPNKRGVFISEGEALMFQQFKLQMQMQTQVQAAVIQQAPAMQQHHPHPDAHGNTNEEMQDMSEQMQISTHKPQMSKRHERLSNNLSKKKTNIIRSKSRSTHINI